MKKVDNFKAKLRKHPYKGVLTEIAREQGSSLQSVWNAVHVNQNPRIMIILKQKMIQRKNEYSQTKQDLLAI